MAAGEKAADYCADLVRMYDRDRYFSTLFAAAEKRNALFALYAFNIEIARIREAISEPTLGEIRLQWWREAIAKIYAGETDNQPVITALARAIKGGKLPEVAFQNLIDARTFDLYDDPMPSLNDLEGYLGETYSMLFQLAGLILAGGKARATSNAAGYAGVAYGLTSLLGALPQMRSRGQCFFPKDILEELGSSPAHVLSGRWEAGEQQAVKFLSNTAYERLNAARDLQNEIPKEALPAYLPCTLIEGLLGKVQKPGFNPQKDTFGTSRLKRQWLMLRAASAKRF